MDSNQLILLKVDLEGQMQIIRNIDQKLRNRAAALKNDEELVLESIAYQIHNIYCASEDLLKIVAACFENNIRNTSQWHSLLLQRMAMEIPAIRPAFLSTDSYGTLNNLRGFRHFFRHAYGASIEPQQLKANLNKALQLKELLEQDIHQFLQQLEHTDQRSP